MILRHLTVDCAEPYHLARFWSEVTGWPVSGEDAPGDDEVLVEAPPPVPGLLFIRMPEGKSVKNRIHFDWMPTGRTRDEEVERVVALGAKLHQDHRTADGLGWVTRWIRRATSSVSSAVRPSVRTSSRKQSRFEHGWPNLRG